MYLVVRNIAVCTKFHNMNLSLKMMDLLIWSVIASLTFWSSLFHNIQHISNSSRTWRLRRPTTTWTCLWRLPTSTETSGSRAFRSAPWMRHCSMSWSALCAPRYYINIYFILYLFSLVWWGGTPKVILVDGPVIYFVDLLRSGEDVFELWHYDYSA